jgi:hypothetical protein
MHPAVGWTGVGDISVPKPRSQVAADRSQEGVEVWGRTEHVLLHLGVPLVAVRPGSVFEALAEARRVDVAVSCLVFNTGQISSGLMSWSVKRACRSNTHLSFSAVISWRVYAGATTLGGWSG